MYNLNNIPLADLGFVAGRQEGSNIALSGFLNMPSRLGTTYFDWANESGIEPYVSADEIFFGGRDLNLKGYIKGIDRNDCENKRLEIISLIDSATGLMPLTSKWGSYQVLVSGQVKSDFLHSNYLTLEIPMREPAPDLTGAIPAADNAEFGIDGISFKSLGGVSLELSGDRRSRPAPKAANFTVYGKEGYAVTHTAAPELVLKLYIKQPGYAAFKTKITGLYALLSAPGMRNLTVNNDKIRNVFAKDGFTLTSLYSKPGYFAGIAELKLTESGKAGTLTDLITVLGDLITDNQGNKFQVRI